MLRMVTRRVKKILAWAFAVGVVGLLVLGLWAVIAVV